MIRGIHQMSERKGFYRGRCVRRTRMCRGRSRRLRFLHLRRRRLRSLRSHRPLWSGFALALGLCLGYWT